MSGEVERIAKGLSEAQKRSVMAFAPAFSTASEHGMWREWADVCYQAGPRRGFHNTIKPLIARGLAERGDIGFCRLTAIGLAVRAHLKEQQQ